MLERHAPRALGVLALAVFIGACAGDRATSPVAATTHDASGGAAATGTPSAAAACTPDLDAPVIASSTLSPGTLWPPNHKMFPVAVTTRVSDACDAAPRCAITSVSSNEPVNGLGDGDTAPDWEVTGALTLLLRAERSGLGTGRVYTVGTTCTDAAGNASTSYGFVTVPHDQGKR